MTCRPATPATLAGLAVLALSSCDRPEPPPEGSPPPLPPPSVSPPPATTWDGPAQGIPVSARVPEAIHVEAAGSGEGVGVFFGFEPGSPLEDAEIHVFLPSGVATVDDLMPFLSGPGGWIENRGWSVRQGGVSPGRAFEYPWLERVIDVEADEGRVGQVLVGASAGQAIQVALAWPPAAGGAFWAVAGPLLESLTFDSSLLPIRTRG